jgi:hypothetical protein
MPDEIIKELWAVKDEIAREHGYDVDALVAHLQATHKDKDREVVDRSALRRRAAQGPAKNAEK